MQFNWEQELLRAFSHATELPDMRIQPQNMSFSPKNKRSEIPFIKKDKLTKMTCSLRATGWGVGRR